jgi:hypothetical protein
MAVKRARGTVNFARSRGLRTLNSSVVNRIKDRIKEKEILIPSKFGGETHGYLRIPVMGEYGIQFVGRVVEILRRRGREINGYTMAEVVMEEFMGGTEGEHLLFEEVVNA